VSAEHRYIFVCARARARVCVCARAREVEVMGGRGGGGRCSHPLGSGMHVMTTGGIVSALSTRARVHSVIFLVVIALLLLEFPSFILEIFRLLINNEW
jgi:hypothetical protein